MAAKIKKNDEVMIMVGKDNGKTGKVIEVYPEKNKVLVEGRNMVKKHQRPLPNREGGIIEKEAPIQVSNVMIIDPSDKKPCRVGFEIVDGKKQRISKRTRTVLD